MVIAMTIAAARKINDDEIVFCGYGEPLLETLPMGELNQAEQHLLKAIEIYQEHYGRAHPSTLGARNNLGWVYRDQGRYDEMEEVWIENLELGQRVWPLIDQVQTMNHLGVAHLIRGKYKEAESTFDKMLYLDQQELQGEYTRRSPWFLGNLAVVYLLEKSVGKGARRRAQMGAT